MHIFKKKKKITQTHTSLVDKNITNMLISQRPFKNFCNKKVSDKRWSGG